ncbi:MAG: LacI family DNA-binding transcriptional regulator [Anaerolineae bacterium]|nr:LacI family DNA-binding transcriptional regulator [Anaerolineae bacterium]
MSQTNKTLTLEKIAVMAGVSRSTVSRVVNHDTSVREETRTLVWDIVHKMGYHPNAAARSLAGHRSHILGIVIPRTVHSLFADPFFPLLLQGASEGTARHGYLLMVSMLDRLEEQDFYRRAVRSQTMDGLIISSAVLDEPLIPLLIEDEVPFVSVGRLTEHPGISYVDVDNLHGARMAVNHLVELGRQRIATITGPLNTIVGLDRLEGYKIALRSAGQTVDYALIAEGDFTEGSGCDAMQQLIDYKPDAVFVASDLMAFGALRTLRHVGLSVPDDIAVVGFDDTQIAMLTEPKLTTIHQPILEMGRAAVDLLCCLVEQNDCSPQRQILSTELVIRDTCGAG